jgi:hypothetical protein
VHKLVARHKAELAAAQEEAAAAAAAQLAAAKRAAEQDAADARARAAKVKGGGGWEGMGGCMCCTVPVVALDNKVFVSCWFMYTHAAPALTLRPSRPNP